MTLTEFRQLVRSEFGSDLHRMTPGNARDFLDRLQVESVPSVPGGKIVINEREQTYEGILRDFLRQVLTMPSEQAVIRLWLYSLELTTAQVSEMEGERAARLFAALGIADPD